MRILHDPSDRRSRYSHYLAELLRSEGFIHFTEADLSTLTESDLSDEDLLILPRVALSAAQMDYLHDYIHSGGRLLALLPDAEFVARLGLQPQHRAIDGGYLQINSGSSQMAGLCTETVQVIVPAVNWQVTDEKSATVFAHIQRDAETTDARIPGVVWSQIGEGSVALFAYDLPHTVARLRQGNPEHVDLCYGGLDGIYRPSELFVDQLPVEKMYLPQADIHTALLARVIEELAPSPRLWYYPEAEQQSVMIMTSDDDWSTLDQFDTLLAGLAKRNAHCTFYVVPKTKLDETYMEKGENAGHTFSVHPALEADTVHGLTAQEPQSRLVRPMLAENINRHAKDFQRTPRTIRQHAVRWLGYVDAAQVEADLGIRMDLNYIAVSPYLGHLCGSGRPMRFVDTDGTLIDCFQQPTHWTEECLIHPEFVFSFKWSVEKAVAETATIINRAANEFYTPIAINSHPVSFATYSSPLIEANWETALEAGMIIQSADEWLEWTEVRYQLELKADKQGFAVTSPNAVESITLLLPATTTAESSEKQISHNQRTDAQPTRLPNDVATKTEHTITEHTITEQQRWGRTYRAVTINHLAANEPYHISW